MRIWRTQESADYADVAKDLDDQRLFAQHREAVGILRMVAGTDEQVHRFRNNGLGIPYKNSHQYLRNVHDSCAAEMLIRGFKHHTPLPMEEFHNFREGSSYIPDSATVAFDRLDLNKRYVLHAHEVLNGIRKHKSDTVRWTFRNIPEWVETETKVWISMEHKSRGRALTPDLVF
jgi:hypothetical protein